VARRARLAAAARPPARRPPAPAAGEAGRFARRSQVAARAALVDAYGAAAPAADLLWDLEVGNVAGLYLHRRCCAGFKYAAALLDVLERADREGARAREEVVRLGASGLYHRRKCAARGGAWVDARNACV